MTIRPRCTLRPPGRLSLTDDNAEIGPLSQFGASATTPETDPIQTIPGDARPVTPADFPYFRHKLHEQLTFVRSCIRAALLRADSEHYAQIAGQVHDAQDESLAELLVDVNCDEVDRNVETIRDVDAAQRRILDHTYGRCLDCGESVDWARLDAYPTAKRCLDCQVRHEEQQGKSTPRL